MTSARVSWHVAFTLQGFLNATRKYWPVRVRGGSPSRHRLSSRKVAMGYPLGPLLANVFMCSIEETLEREGKMPTYYRRYVDDTLTIMPDKLSADNFLVTLNNCHSSLKFTMEIENDGMLPFLGIQLLNKSTQIQTKTYVKPTKTGLLHHYKSHVDDRYKRGLLKTMIDRAFRLSVVCVFYFKKNQEKRE